MDNPATESKGELDLNQAGAAFAELLEPIKQVEDVPSVDTEIDTKGDKEPTSPEIDEATEPEEGRVTVNIDGKDVVLTKAQIAEAYKDGLRQADYTKKTMQAAEVTKSAQAEISKAQQERQQYAANLDRMAAQLEAVLQEQQQIDWDTLSKTDPALWVEQRNLYEKRQAAYQQNMQQRQYIAAQQEAEQAEAKKAHIATQQQELLAKLPAWKDAAKAGAERDAIKAYLKNEGYGDEDIAGIGDHRAVILARKAMLYDQMLSKATAATKKVATLPQKVERPGVADSPQMDKRSAAYQRLSKSGRVEDAAALFSSIL